MGGESSFRELDDAFLQSQTRIWLGEVVKMRLDDHLPVSHLLADGDLLFEVSKVLWDMLLAKCGELRHFKYEPLGSRRCSGGRYRPYSNVDSFLKICKILGLNGIDLFSPSDVVEKKNTRKVCICIRALSNKARSKQLKVPDFDLVTYTVVMPKDMVGGIRRSLETSQCSLSSSSGYYSYKETRSILMESFFETRLNLSVHSKHSSHTSPYKVFGSCLSQDTTTVPNIPRRFMTTGDTSASMVPEDASASSLEAPRIKFKRLDKTAKHIMQILDKEAVEEVRAQSEIPDIKPGYIIQLKLEVPENKRRNSIIKGIVIARRNAGLNTTFRLRRLVAGVGVENLFHLYSPNIKEIKVLDKKKVRRAKLYYLRDKMNALKKHSQAKSY